MSEGQESRYHHDIAKEDFEHMDDTDADAFAVLCLLVIIAATIIYYFNG